MIAKKSNVTNLDIKEPILLAKSVEAAFKDIFLANYDGPGYLSSGREIPHIKQRPRELLGLCIMSYLAKYLTGEDWVPGTDPWGYDGTVMVAEGKREGTALIVEQVYVSEYNKKSLDEALSEAIVKKSSKGEAYHTGVNLLIFGDRNDVLNPALAIQAAQSSPFGAVYFFSLVAPGSFKYYVLTLKSPADPLRAYTVDIDPSTGNAKVHEHNETAEDAAR